MHDVISHSSVAKQQQSILCMVLYIAYSDVGQFIACACQISLVYSSLRKRYESTLSYFWLTLIASLCCWVRQLDQLVSPGGREWNRVRDWTTREKDSDRESLEQTCTPCKYIWALRQENLPSGGGVVHVNNNGPDQPAHPRRLISAFVICFLERIISKLATSEISVF